MTTEDLEICPVTGKNIFPTKKAAKQAVKSIKNKGRVRNNSADYYECRHCEGLHITSGRKKAQYRRRKKRKNRKDDLVTQLP